MGGEAAEPWRIKRSSKGGCYIVSALRSDKGLTDCAKVDSDLRQEGLRF
jgi:hypothetical protein